MDGEGYSCMAANEKGHEIAMGKPDGSITVWDVQEWRVKFELKSGAGAISALKYGAVKSSKLPNPFLLVRSEKDQHACDHWLLYLLRHT